MKAGGEMINQKVCAKMIFLQLCRWSQLSLLHTLSDLPHLRKLNGVFSNSEQAAPLFLRAYGNPRPESATIAFYISLLPPLPLA